MKRTNKAVAGVLIAGLLATLVLVPQAAEAGGRHYRHGGGGYGHHHGHHGGGYYAPFWGGLAVGAVTGVVVGSVLAPRVYAAPPPVVYQPAAGRLPAGVLELLGQPAVERLPVDARILDAGLPVAPSGR